MGGWDNFMEHKSEVRCRRGFHSHISLSRKTRSLEAVLQVVAPAKDAKRGGGEITKGNLKSQVDERQRAKGRINQIHLCKREEIQVIRTRVHP